jgi:tRNA threonylcarbamoyladenosine biosynthesis protein TsaE
VSWQRYCSTSASTEVAGADFARVLTSGDIVLLVGSLGAGKTTFVKGVARGLGVRERVTSPTFTIVRQHECDNDLGIKTLHHADVFRVEGLDEVFDLALGELVEESGVAFIEWGNLAVAVYGPDVVRVSFDVDAVDGRFLTVDGQLAERRTSQLDEWARA